MSFVFSASFEQSYSVDQSVGRTECIQYFVSTSIPRNREWLCAVNTRAAMVSEALSEMPCSACIMAYAQLIND